MNNEYIARLIRQLLAGETIGPLEQHNLMEFVKKLEADE